MFTLKNAPEDQIIQTLKRQIGLVDILGRGERLSASQLALLTEPEWICPEKYTFQKVEKKDFTLEILAPQKENRKYAVLQLHGGGYIGALSNDYRDWAYFYSKFCHQATVFSPDYRRAPKNPFPAALEDALASYAFIVAGGYEKIFVVGDSSGGGLALSLTRSLLDAGFKAPAGIIVMSPFTDLTLSGPSLNTNYEKDVIFGKTRNSILYNKAYLGKTDPENPYISPVFAEYAGFPPLLMQVGSDEMLLDDTTRVAEKAEKAGVSVTLTVYEGMFHDFEKGNFSMDASRKAWAEICTFFNQF